MKQSQRIPVSTISSVTAAFLLIYVLIDYFNIPTAVGIDISRINIDLLGNVLNAVIIIFVFVAGYYLIDCRNIQKQKNQKAIAESLLLSIYKECLLYIEILDQPQIATRLVAQTDFDKHYHELNDPSPHMRYAQIPFMSEASLLSYFQEGILDRENLDAYQNIKKAFKSYVCFRVIFHNAPERYQIMRKKVIQLLNEQLHSYRK